MRIRNTAVAAYGQGRREQVLVAGAVMLMTVLGGGPASVPVPRFAAGILAAALLGLILVSSRSHRPVRFSFGDGLVIAFLALIAAQLVPVPAAVWTALPGRSLAVAVDMAVFGKIGWRPLSLDPSLTVETAIQLLPALVTYLAVRIGPPARCVAVLDGVLIGGCLGLVMGVLQMLLPGTAALTPYPRGDYLSPTGFFTNHNHQAVFLGCLIPIALIRSTLVPWPGVQLPAAGKATIGLGLTGVVACVILATGSRMGTVLLLPLLALSVLALRGVRKLSLILVLILTAGIGLMATLGGTRLGASLERGDLASDQRWDFYRDVWQANLAYWPVGAGLGTFPIAYAPHEPLLHLGPHYLNHAHNDYLELALEAGAAGVMIAAVAVIWFLYRMAAAYRNGALAGMQTLHRLACIPPFILLMHSIFDYPLRTFAVQILMSFCIATLSTEYPAVNFRIIRNKRSFSNPYGN